MLVALLRAPVTRFTLALTGARTDVRPAAKVALHGRPCATCRGQCEYDERLSHGQAVGENKPAKPMNASDRMPAMMKDSAVPRTRFGTRAPSAC